MKKLVLVIALILILPSFVSAVGFTGSTSRSATFYSTPQFDRYYSSAQIQTYWPILASKDSCTAREDVMVQVAPFGCQPAVVRSDLLAEQNVPVFCQLDALRINPLINLKEIRSFDFSGSYPKEIAGISYHPARAAIRTQDELLGDPFLNNIGYIVIVLKRNANESALPNFLNFTLNGKLSYRSGNALGVGKSDFLLSPVSDAEWKNERNKQSFFNGQFFLRLDSADSKNARVSIYSGDRKITSTNVALGSSSSEIYLPGSYCQVTLKAYYDSYAAGTVFAEMQIDDDVVDVYSGGKFLNGKCTVSRIGSGDARNQSVQVRCGSQTYSLSVSPSTLNVGDSIRATKKGANYVQGVISNVTNDGKYEVLVQGSDGKNSKQIFGFTEVEPLDAADRAVNKDLSGSAKTYYDKALESFKQVAEDYPHEKQPEQQGLNTPTYGEQALVEAIRLADSPGIDQKRTKRELIQVLVDTYPNSSSARFWQGELNGYDTSAASVVANIDNSIRTIRLLRIVEPKTTSTARFVLGTNPSEIPASIGGNISFVDLHGNKSYFVLESIEVDNARIVEYCNDGRSIRKGSSHTLRVGAGGELTCGMLVKLSDVDVDQFAKIRLEPVVKTTGVANFSVGIGIEKRAIKLTPDKALERANELNDTIRKWESISNNLGNAVKGLKAACFATTGVLTVKSFLTGLDGTALARQQVMRGTNGWTKKCGDLVSQGIYPTLTACYNAKASDIDKDVTAYSNAIQSTNNDLKRIEAPFKTPSGSSFGLEGDSLDQENASAQLISELKTKYGTDIVGVNDRGQNLRVNDILASDSYRQGNVGYTQLRDMYTNLRITHGDAGIVSDVTRENAKDKLQAITSDVYDRQKTTQVSSELGNSLQNTGLRGTQVPSYGPKDAVSGEYYGKTLGNSDFGLNLGGKPAQVITYGQTPYLLVLDDLGSGTYATTDVYRLDKSTSTYDRAMLVTNNSEGLEIKRRFSSFRKIDATSYNNHFDKPQVQYYETEPYKGLPALVPFDVDHGWYVATRQTLPGLGNIKAFQTSGKPASFWICNVGVNKRADFFNGVGDDVCRQFNMDTGQALDIFPGLSTDQTQKLVRDAQRALQDASDQRSQGQKTQAIIGGKKVDVGTPAANIPGTQCQDFMSPEDCQILFNVCDPVICPPSRCDLGGLYPVSDVIQTGVIGSALLCLPNAREGIAIPVCLTGIKAGIDGYLSILKSEQQCLLENAQTGRSTGICDVITSVYTCEFFWRQAAPVANILLPKLVEAAYGQQRTHGGGEYLTVQGAWDNAQSSANYFTQTYAVNSLDAFKIRSIEEAGTAFCRSFISAQGPNSFESLIEPDSPAQFHAWFSSTTFNDVTVPATSQYKVFYHIFAGNDQGTYYTVYLKDPPQTSYYSSTATIVVDSGYVPRGQFRTETKDFTAPEGYKQLCVRINGKDECGFKEVSTDFAVNYVRDEIVKDQITEKDITSEATCISGSTSAASLLNANPEEVAQEAIDPAIYNRGISRICSTLNPGQGTDPTRFVEVGYCGDQKVKCWLDKKSIDNAITSNNIGINNQTLQQVTQMQKQALENGGQLLSDTEFNKLVDDSNVFLQTSSFEASKLDDLVKRADGALEKAFLQFQRAQIIYFKGLLYKKGAMSVRDATVPAVQPDSSFVGPPAQTESETSTAGSQGLTLSQTYSPDTRITIRNQSVDTGIYLLNSRVYIEGSSSPLGTVVISNGETTIQLLSTARTRIQAYFDELNGSKIDGNKITQTIINNPGQVEEGSLR